MRLDSFSDFSGCSVLDGDILFAVIQEGVDASLRKTGRRDFSDKHWTFACVIAFASFLQFTYSENNIISQWMYKYSIVNKAQPMKSPKDDETEKSDHFFWANQQKANLKPYSWFQ